MDQRLRLLEHQFLSGPNIQRLHAYIVASQRAGQSLTRNNLANLFSLVIRPLVDEVMRGDRRRALLTAGWPLRLELLVTDYEPLRILFSPPPSGTLRDRQYEAVGPVIDICSGDRGGVPVGSCFIRLVIDAAHHRYLLLNPKCMYQIPQEVIDYLNHRIIDEFDSVGWSYYGSTAPFLSDYA